MGVGGHAASLVGRLLPKIKRRSRDHIHEIRVLGQGPIGGQEARRLVQGLPDEEAVEGIAMVERQAPHARRVHRGHGEFKEPHPSGRLGDLLRRHGQIDASDLRLDGQFPDAGR